MTDQDQQAELPPRPETCNEIIMDYMDSLEAALAAANRRAEEAEQDKQRWVTRANEFEARVRKLEMK